jgi:hypothetical protein
LLTFPRKEESPLILKATTPYAHTSRTTRSSIRFPDELQETEANHGSFYTRPKTTYDAMTKLPLASMTTLPGCPMTEWKNAKHVPTINTMQDWFKSFGRGERTPETSKYFGCRLLTRDTSARRFIGTTSCTVRPPNPQVRPQEP